MALSKTMTLANGIKLKYHVIGLIEVEYNKDIKIHLDGFISKDIYDKATSKDRLLKEQEELVEKFNELEAKEKLTKTQETKRDKLFNDINDLADKIATIRDYPNYVIGTMEVTVPFSEKFDIDTLQNLLLKTNEFKSARIVN